MKTKFENQEDFDKYITNNLDNVKNYRKIVDKMKPHFSDLDHKLLPNFLNHLDRFEKHFQDISKLSLDEANNKFEYLDKMHDIFAEECDKMALKSNTHIN